MDHRTPFVAAALAALSWTTAAAQQPAATRAVAPRYAAGPLHQALLGTTYRDLWTAPTAIPVLDLGSYAGGLTPIKRGGGLQTISLRFRSGDGRDFSFRSVDKDQTQSLHPDLRHTVVAWAVQDQISSLVPAAGLVAHEIEDAAGVPHTWEQLFVMPDDPRLGEFRREFAGMVGTVEERPKLGDTNLPGMGGADRVEEDADSLYAALQSGPGERFDDREYLAARLVDILLGDWDRHSGQYEWLRYPAPGGGHLWRTMPRDRDYAFVDYDGLLPELLHASVHNAVRYRPRIELLPMLIDAAPQDRRLLGALPRAAWDSVARAVQARVTDAAIDRAVSRMPAEWRARRGARLTAALRGRRDGLARVAAEYYAVIAREPEAHATDRADDATIQRLPSGNVRVTIVPRGGGAPEFDREFNWVETREVRVYLHDGDDHAAVVGPGPEQVIVRVIGGGGGDTLEDLGRAGHRTAFYDDAGDNRFATRPHTRVDEHTWEEKQFVVGQGRTPPRDWGFSASLASPSFGWRPGGVGPFLGIGPTWTRYGFRREPYAVRQQLRAMWAIEHARYGVEYLADFRYVGRPMDQTLALARASEMEATRFYGFGNDTDDGGFRSSHFRVFERQLLGDAAHWHGIGRDAWLVLGATGRFTDPEPIPGTPAGAASLHGSSDFLLLGGRAGLVFRRIADTLAYQTRGWTLQTFGQGFPLAHHDASAFGGASAVGTAYLSASNVGPTLALRAGGQRLWGGFPFQYAAFLGGDETIRGYPSQRFAGDASAYGSAELRQVLTRAKLIVHGELGAFGLADAGRVWYRGASPGGWHTAYGGGLFFTTMGRKHAAYAGYAKGEEGTVYFGLGLPF
jgi:hypothetical protein